MIQARNITQKCFDQIKKLQPARPDLPWRPIGGSGVRGPPPGAPEGPPGEVWSGAAGSFNIVSRI